MVTAEMERPLNVLIVEDNANAASVFQLCFAHTAIRRRSQTMAKQPSNWLNQSHSTSSSAIWGCRISMVSRWCGGCARTQRYRTARSVR